MYNCFIQVVCTSCAQFNLLFTEHLDIHFVSSLFTERIISFDSDLYESVESQNWSENQVDPVLKFISMLTAVNSCLEQTFTVINYLTLFCSSHKTIF